MPHIWFSNDHWWHSSLIGYFRIFLLDGKWYAYPRDPTIHPFITAPEPELRPRRLPVRAVPRAPFLAP